MRFELPNPTLVFLLYQKGRDSRIFQAQDRAIDEFTLIAVTGTTGRSSARVIAIEEPTGASCSRTTAVTVLL